MRLRPFLRDGRPGLLTSGLEAAGGQRVAWGLDLVDRGVEPVRGAVGAGDLVAPKCAPGSVDLAASQVDTSRLT
jgi:hypothetical protein